MNVRVLREAQSVVVDGEAVPGGEECSISATLQVFFSAAKK
jgi:hypothetical protein